MAMIERVVPVLKSEAVSASNIASCGLFNLRFALSKNKIIKLEILQI